ncbi:histidine-tRNA synthetase, partial [Pseudoloma neurophilia]
KGTIDFDPADSKLINEIIDKSKKVFELHGGRSLDTPTFELLEILKNKSEESLIFELNDQGGDICGLRFDLTVPLARYLAQNNVTTLRRYQIGKVYRRDQPAITKGRYREFYQCDFDICGNFIPLLPDAESIKIADEILESFDIGEFIIKINHRKLITAMCLFCLEGESVKCDVDE